MTKNCLKQATSFLQNPNKDLQFLLSKIKKLQQLQEQVNMYLEPTVLPLCHVANLFNNKLIIVTAKASIATLLRLQTADLLIKFKHNPLLSNIQFIECKVSPKLSETSSPTQRKIHKVARLSAGTAEMIETIADTLDEPLKKVMQRIAKQRDLEK